MAWSLWLVILMTLLTPISASASWKHIDHRVKAVSPCSRTPLEFGLIGVFVLLDLFLFYVFWEIGLVPRNFLIGIWGHDRRIYAAVEVLHLHLSLDAVLMLAAIIFPYQPRRDSFDYTQSSPNCKSGRLALKQPGRDASFLAFFIAFA